MERYRPHWMEESLAAGKVESFAQLRRSTSVPVATGERIYGRWEAHSCLRAGAVNVPRTDPEWCGGVSELTRIRALASIFDVRIIPHGHALHAALHVVASQSPTTCPLVEHLVLKVNSWHHLQKQPLVLASARIALPQRPGFGIKLDPAKVESQSLLCWNWRRRASADLPMQRVGSGRNKSEPMNVMWEQRRT